MKPFRQIILALLCGQRWPEELELENSRLRKAVSDLTLDKLILREAARGS